jgi:peptidoglycan/xylan/chitin deacetylase (PgdA/CDA1 family)
VKPRLLVLCYHNVDPTWCFPFRPGAGARGLERQLRALRRWANVVPLDTALRALAEGRPLPPRAVALSFDDGYRDNLTLAVPMLERLGLPATFFLVPGLLSNEALPWWEVVSWAVSKASVPSLSWDGTTYPLTDEKSRRTALDEVQRTLKRRSRQERDATVRELAVCLAPTGSPPSADAMFLDWDEGARLLERGFTIGSHTCAHAILSGETAEEQTRDLVDSRRLLQQRFSVGADLLAYPNGTPLDYDAATLAAARVAGHTAALTTREGFNDPGTPALELRRVVIYPERGLADLAVNLRYALRPDSG